MDAFFRILIFPLVMQILVLNTINTTAVVYNDEQWMVQMAYNEARR